MTGGLNFISSSNNKLLSHKSAFQAWKCVSFGCSLLVMVLLLSKWHEVSTDLQLVLGIERLLNGPSEQVNRSLTWPPVPLEVLLPAANETNFGPDSMESNGTMLMSHMHISLSRELTGNQLLHAEIEAFAAEFRTAKSTLSLSLLLISVYIVSWILMTLAINDTRISNDISLRNILLLSVFGAIDMAASVGFVMVRLIMYSVKNRSFASEMLGIIGLKDAPVRLGTDQLTAFAALRLIAMRSCSAYVDIYVSVLVSLLTLLRLYAILKALAYYKHLRRINYFQQMAQQHQQVTSAATGNVGAANNDSNPAADRKQQIWSTGFYETNSSNQPALQMISSSPSAEGRQQQRIVHHTPQPDYPDQSFFRSATTTTNGAGKTTGTFKFHQVGSVRPSTSGKLILSGGAARTVIRRNAATDDDADHSSQVLHVAGQRGHLTDRRRESRKLLSSLMIDHIQSQQQQQQPDRQNPRPPSRLRQFTASRPNLLVVNGRTHQIVPEDERPDEEPSMSLKEALLVEDQLSKPAETGVKGKNTLRKHADRSHHQTGEQVLISGASDSGSGSGPSTRQVLDLIHSKSHIRESAASDQELLFGERRRRRPTVALPVGYNTVRPNGTTSYTLLSAQQLDKLGRKLATTTSNGARSKSATKYRLVSHYKPADGFPGSAVVSATPEERSVNLSDPQRHRRENSLLDESSTSSSSSTCNPAEDSDQSTAATNNPAGSRQRRQPRLLGVRQSEELTADLMRQKVFEVSDSNQNLLLGKYYYA